MSRKDGQPQIRKIGKDYYLNMTDLIEMLNAFGEFSLDEFMAKDEKDLDEFDCGWFEGDQSRLEHLINLFSILIADKRLEKIDNIEKLFEEFPSEKFIRNRSNPLDK
jgi:hypothetical protein